MFCESSRATGGIIPFRGREATCCSPCLEVYRRGLGNDSAARRLGGSAARRLGGSAARRLGGSADRQARRVTPRPGPDGILILPPAIVAPM
jgi:hypothetical protein